MTKRQEVLKEITELGSLEYGDMTRIAERVGCSREYVRQVAVEGGMWAGRTQRIERTCLHECCGNTLSYSNTKQWCQEHWRLYQEPPPHGTQMRYLGTKHREPCRCRECKDGNTQRHRAARERAIARFRAGEVDVEHGIANTYSFYKCRCRECVRAYSEYQRPVKARLRARLREKGE